MHVVDHDGGDPGHEADADGYIRPAHDLAIAVDCKRLGDQPKSDGQPLRMRDFQQGTLLGNITHDARDDRPPAQENSCVHTRLPAPELASLCAPHALDSHVQHAPQRG